MFPGPIQTESYMALPLHQRGIHHRSNDPSIPAYGAAPRQVIGLPPPLEPRTPHALLQPAPSQPRRDTYAGPSGPPPRPEGRPQGHSLPRLQDILTSAAPPSISSPAHAPYGNVWGAANGPAVNPHHGESYHGHAGIHPPLAYPPPPPPPHAAPSYHPPPPAPPPPGRRLDLPILETGALPREGLPPGPRSPRSTGEPGVEYGDPRGHGARPPPTASYLPHSAQSPYMPVGVEESMYRSPVGTYDRPPTGPFGSAVPECNRKYLGIRDTNDGTFHVYEGGFRIPTQIEGEPVNPAWGLTKANKPRKRLAMACLDCREKKIKCEPGVSSCLQCEKAKRICRKAPAHQSQTEPGSAIAWQSGTSPPARRDSSEPTQSVFRGTEADLAQKRRTREEYSPSRLPTKKHRSMSPGVAPLDGAGAPPVGAYHVHTPAATVAPRSPSRTFMLEEDPFAVNPDMVIHLVNHYFLNINNMIYNIFPRQHFMHWLKSRQSRDSNERMVLYAMIAVGSMFTDDRFAECGHRCAEIAAEAVQSTIGQRNVLIVQARLILSIWYFAKGQNATAWDYFNFAVSAHRYDTEQGCREPEDLARTRYEFGFSLEQLVECRRRTMWSIFLMDRYTDASTCQIDSGNLFLKLPCLDERYERGMPSDAPLFSDALIGRPDSPLSASSPISTNGWLMFMVAVCGDVVNFIHRAPHRPARGYKEAYQRFYDTTHTALQDWSARLPEYLRFNVANVERSVEAGYAGPFVAMHILHHYSAMKLNRFVRHSLIPDAVSRNIRAAGFHAHELLKVIRALQGAKTEMAPDGLQPIPFAFTLPFAGNAIVSATDIVSAGGIDDHLRTAYDLIIGGLDCLRELTGYWVTAREQCKTCELRSYQISNIIKHPNTARSGCWLGRKWGMIDGIGCEFGLADDCIYGVSDTDFFDAMKEGMRSPHIGPMTYQFIYSTFGDNHAHSPTEGHVRTS